MKLKIVVLLLLLCGGVFTAFPGSASTQPSLVLVDNAGIASGGQLEGGAALAGRGDCKYLTFNGKSGCRAIFPVGPEFDGQQDISLSFWFRLNTVPERERILKRRDRATVLCRDWSWRVSVLPSLSIRASMAGVRRDVNIVGGNVELKTWNSGVVIYSATKNKFVLYLNGVPVAESREHSVMEPLKKPEGPLILGEDPENYSSFDGDIAMVNVFPRALTPEEVAGIHADVPGVVLTASVNELRQWQRMLDSQNAAELCPSAGEKMVAVRRAIAAAIQARNVQTLRAVTELKPLIAEMLTYPNDRRQLLDWCSALRRCPPAERETADRLLREIEAELEKSDFSAAEFVRCHTSAVSALLQHKIPMKDALCYVVSPMSGVPVTPDSRIEDRYLGSRMKIALTPGEYESGSFVLRPVRNLTGVRFDLPTLEDGRGHTIPAADLDLKIVQCWYQAGSAWREIGQNSAKRVLVPELLVNDPELVRVDRSAQMNYLRLSFADGEKYVPVCHPEKKDYRTRWEMSIKTQEYPVRDSETLQPVSLAANENRQFFLTVKAPEDVPPGLYTGQLAITSDQGAIGSIEISVNLLPFRLAGPKTNYDPQRDFVPSIYYVSVLDPESKGDLTPFYRTQTQYRNELQDLRRHGISNPLCYQLQNARGRKPWDLDEFRNVLKLRQEAGLSNRPLFLSGPESNLSQGFGETPQALALAKKRVGEILDLVEKTCGHRDVYFYGIDELRGSALQKQRGIWQAIHDAGGKVFVACNDMKGVHGESSFKLVGDLLDLVVYSETLSRGEAAKWHGKGSLIWSYDNPQGGVENPELYRRNYGLQLYLNNYDGSATYCYYEAFGNPWDDFDFPVFRDHNLVYPTADGVVDTIAWEGCREAVDDIRYATTLRETAAAARKSGDPAKVRLAGDAEKWLQSVDVEHGDLDGIRAGMIGWILKLRGAQTP